MHMFVDYLCYDLVWTYWQALEFWFFWDGITIMEWTFQKQQVYCLLRGQGDYESTFRNQGMEFAQVL